MIFHNFECDNKTHLYACAYDVSADWGDRMPYHKLRMVKVNAHHGHCGPVAVAADDDDDDDDDCDANDGECHC